MNCLLTFPKREKSCVSVILKSMDCWLAYVSKKKKKKKKNEENFGLIIFVTKLPWCLLFVFFGFLVKYNPSE